jgi:NAD(P)H dehydrogenase (quinone)
MITVLTAHPDPDSFNVALARAYTRGAVAAGVEVRVVDVTALEFDPLLRGAYRQPMADERDLADLRATILASGHLAWFFPVWWAGLPAVLKGLIDRLFLPEWAFRFEGRALPRGLLAGRSARYVATMDSPRLWYQLAHHDALAGSFGRATLRFVGLAPVDRTMIYSARTLAPEARAAWLARLADQGRADARALQRRAPQREALQAG